MSGINGIRTCPVTPGAVHSYWLYPLYYEGNDLEQFAKILKQEQVLGSIGYTVKPIYLCAESLTAKKTYGNSEYPFTWKDVEKNYEYKEGLCPKAEGALKHLFCINLNECWTRERIENRGRDPQELRDVEYSNGRSSAKDQRDRTGKGSPRQRINKKIRVGIIGCADGQHAFDRL